MWRGRSSLSRPSAGVGGGDEASRCFRRSGMTLDDRTLDRIAAALTTEAQAAGSNMPVRLN